MHPTDRHNQRGAANLSSARRAVPASASSWGGRLEGGVGLRVGGDASALGEAVAVGARRGMRAGRARWRSAGSARAPSTDVRMARVCVEGASLSQGARFRAERGGAFRFVKARKSDSLVTPNDEPKGRSPRFHRAPRPPSPPSTPNAGRRATANPGAGGAPRCPCRARPRERQSVAPGCGRRVCVCRAERRAVRPRQGAERVVLDARVWVEGGRLPGPPAGTWAARTQKSWSLGALRPRLPPASRALWPELTPSTASVISSAPACGHAMTAEAPGGVVRPRCVFALSKTSPTLARPPPLHPTARPRAQPHRRRAHHRGPAGRHR